MTRLAHLCALLCLCFLAACATHEVPVGSTAAADCDLPDALRLLETVAPLPEDHDLSVQEVWDALKEHMFHENQIANRSNDKTKFVADHCRPGHAALPAAPVPAKPAAQPSWFQRNNPF